MTVQEAAERLGRPSRTVRWLAAQGRLPGAVKAGRDWWIPATAVEAALVKTKER